MHRHAAPHLQWAIEVVWNTGSRPGPKELFALRWSEHVDFDRGVVRMMGKRDLYREVPMSDAFRARLLTMRAQAKTDHVIEYEGRPITQLRRSVKNAARRAGLTYSVCIYDVRQLFATVLLSRGADLAAVSRILEHTSTKMTADQYNHLLSGEKKRAVEMVPTIGQKEGVQVRRLRFVE
ncbi:MAG: tyrosine-type recombinase/integrase [Deltaproteobacteria bacterium]|nr:tyrosine-type recombinase/integrase [Deltaproteobacteria bacterium]